MKTIWQKCAERKAERIEIKARKQRRKKALYMRHYWNRKSMTKACRKINEVSDREAMRPRIALINSLDIPLAEKRARIQLVMSQERAA